MPIQTSVEYLFTYFVTLFVAGLLGSLMIWWFENRFESWIAPLCDRIIARRKYVLEREERKK